MMNNILESTEILYTTDLGIHIAKTKILVPKSSIVVVKPGIIIPESPNELFEAISYANTVNQAYRYTR